MKKILIGLVGGIIGAIINVAFLFFSPNLAINIYLSTAITWIVIGILISTCNFELNGIIKGILVAVLVSASSLVYTISSSFIGAIWSIVNTVIVGAIIGYAIEKISNIIANKNR